MFVRKRDLEEIAEYMGINVTKKSAGVVMEEIMQKVHSALPTLVKYEATIHSKVDAL